MNLFSDFAKAVSQLFDPKFLWVLIKAVGISAVLFGGAYFGLIWLAVTVLPGSITLPWLGTIPLGDWFSAVAFTGALIMAVFLMFPVAAVFLGFFLEEIADAVEAKHYPNLPKVQPLSFGAVMGDSLRFLMIMIVANLLALIIYFASSLLAPVIFYIVNGFLLGREYFQLVAMRRLGERAATKLRKAHRWEIWFAGILMAVPLSIPVVNLLVPLLGVATFTHVFHRLNQDRD
ncbi:MAG: EI24 domain-containing protein [Rhodobacteraceae bacterium]|nr:EI24 domain-containing protein [Paracoccaceae bacterium]